MNTCNLCGNPLTPQQIKDKIEPVTIKHRDNKNNVIESKVIPHDDSFFEIVSGKHRGSLVHRWNIIK